MTTPDLDPIELLREGVQASTPAPSTTDAARQRARLDGVTCAPTHARRLRDARCWLPVSLGSVAAVAAAAFLTAALLPGSDASRSDSRGSQADDRAPALRLAGGIAGGAFSGLDLDSASAAEVLEAAGESAAAGMPDTDGAPWTYTRTVTRMDHDMVSTAESWTSPDGEDSYIVERWTGPKERVAEPGIMAAYNGLDGDNQTVSYVRLPDGTNERRSPFAAKGEPTTQDASLRSIREGLENMKEPNGPAVRRLVRGSIEVNGEQLGPRGLCHPKGGCSFYGVPPSSALVGREEATEIVTADFEREYLVKALATFVLEPDQMRALYDALATSWGVDRLPPVVTPTTVTVRFPTFQAGGPHMTSDTIVLDRATGRVLRRIQPGTMGMDRRWVAAGAATEPGSGGVLCREYPEACEELRDLAERKMADPDATLRDVMTQEELSAQFRRDHERLRAEADVVPAR